MESTTSRESYIIAQLTRPKAEIEWFQSVCSNLSDNYSLRMAAHVFLSSTLPQAVRPEWTGAPVPSKTRQNCGIQSHHVNEGIEKGLFRQTVEPSKEAGIAAEYAWNCWDGYNDVVSQLIESPEVEYQTYKLVERKPKKSANVSFTPRHKKAIANIQPQHDLDAIATYLIDFYNEATASGADSSLILKYRNDARCFASLKRIYPKRIDAYEVQPVGGRLSHIGGGDLTCSRAMKHAAWASYGFFDNDIEACHATLMVILAREFGVYIPEELLSLVYNKQATRQYLSQLCRCSVKQIKNTVCALLYGCSMNCYYFSSLRDYLPDEKAFEDFKLWAAPIVEMRKKMLSHFKERKGSILTNDLGMKLTVGKAEQALAHVMLGREQLAILSLIRDHKIISYQYDGVVTREPLEGIELHYGLNLSCEQYTAA